MSQNSETFEFLCIFKRKKEIHSPSIYTWIQIWHICTRYMPPRSIKTAISCTLINSTRFGKYSKFGSMHALTHLFSAKKHASWSFKKSFFVCPQKCVKTIFIHIYIPWFKSLFFSTSSPIHTLFSYNHVCALGKLLVSSLTVLVY